GSQGSKGQQGSGQTGGSSQPLEETGATQEIGDIFRALADKGASKDSAVIALPHIGATDKAPANPMLRDAVLLHARRAKAMTQSLVAALSPMLCGDMEYSANSKSGNRINQSRITRAITDRDPALFRKIHIEEDQSVAVQILIDTSGSTSGAVLDAEIVSALGIASALEHFQDVETAISHFPGSAWAGRMVHAPFIKAFGQPVTSCYAKWPTATGGTPLADAYVSAWFNFLHSEKQRKILIILTDGMPDNAQAAAKEKAKLTRLGVEVYGVIISKQPYPAGMFDDSEQISSPNALPRSLSALVRRNL
ncbi:vWA domain-containing protein, partial [Falsigemmobacter intermedius]